MKNRSIKPIRHGKIWFIELLHRKPIFFITLLAVVLAINIVSAAEQYKPYLHKPSVGDTPKLKTFGEYL